MQDQDSITDARATVYYLPVWFQAIDGSSAVESGIQLLPMVMPIVAASIATGQLVSRIGYYTPFMIFGVCLTAIGAGLLTTLQVNTSKGQWIGFQIVYGLGLGCCSQAPNMAAQTVLPRKEVAIGASLMFFGQQLFGAVFTSVGQNVLDNQLVSRLAGVPGITPRLVQTTGATELLNNVPAKYHIVAVKAYNDSLRVCFQVGLIMACVSIVGAAGMEWRSVKSQASKISDVGRAAEEGKDQSERAEKIHRASQTALANTSMSAMTKKQEQRSEEKTSNEISETTKRAA